MKSNSLHDRIQFRSACPVASSLDILGDRWTLVVIRDLFGGAKRYNDFLASPERITTSILANRLKMLETESLIEKTAYQQHPERFEYSLSNKGSALRPVLEALISWNNTWIPERGQRLRPGSQDPHPWRM